MLTILSNKPLQIDKMYFHTLKAPLSFSKYSWLSYFIVFYILCKAKLKGHNITEKLTYSTSAETKFGKNMCPKNSAKLYKKVYKMNSHFSNP